MTLGEDNATSKRFGSGREKTTMTFTLVAASQQLLSKPTTTLINANLARKPGKLAIESARTETKKMGNRGVRDSTSESAKRCRMCNCRSEVIPMVPPVGLEPTLNRF